jgi:hypothetical protein
LHETFCQHKADNLISVKNTNHYKILDDSLGKAVIKMARAQKRALAPENNKTLNAVTEELLPMFSIWSQKGSAI